MSPARHPSGGGRWARALALALALVALAAAVPTAARAAPSDLPEYPGAKHTRIGRDLVIGGEYFRLAYFLTQDPLPKVARYFHAHWKEQGYPVTVDGDFTREGVVSAFYTREGLQRSVVLRAHGGQTLGFSVVRDLWAKPPGRAPAALLPLETALFGQDLSARGSEDAAHHRSAVLPFGLEKARAEVHARLEQKGFRLQRETGGGAAGGTPQRVLEHQRQGEQVVSTLMEVDKQTTALVQTWLRAEVRP